MPKLAQFSAVASSVLAPAHTPLVLASGLTVAMSQ
jgi:hypothetical protein